MKNIAIIPARGGSKRLKNKNIKPLLGIPLIGYSIKDAIACTEIDEVYITTDCNEIKAVGTQLGAKIIDRPKELAGDYATTVSAIQHAVDFLGLQPDDNIVLLQATNPLRPKNLISDTLHLFNEKKLDSLFSVSKNHHKLGEIIDDKFYPSNYEFGQRSQDMKKLYYENGLIYISKIRLIQQGVIFNSESFPYCIDKNFPIVDIDYLEDFQYAEYLLKSI